MVAAFADAERQQALLAGEFVLIVDHDDPKKLLKLPIYKVTPIGSQVLALGVPQPNLNYMRSVGRELCKQGFRVQFARYRRLTDTEINYFDPELLCPEPVVEAVTVVTQPE